MFRVLIDGFTLRCPRCHRGKVYRSWFSMRRQCPVCALPFEEASGEITGGMGVSIVVALLFTIVAAGIVGFSSVPLLPAFAAMGVAIIVFCIAFYPFSRSLWLGIIYLTGDNSEGD